MKILILAYYVGNSPPGGGSGRFMQCVADTLAGMGHNVVTSTEPEKHIDIKYDLIICSHFLHRIEKNPSQKICISHGIINDERLYTGADRYVSISEEVKAHNLKHGIYSEVINQPIMIRERKNPGKELKKILIIKRPEYSNSNLFEFLSERYDLRVSDVNIPIENQIDWADLCIVLGRGALESMARGKPVLVADNRNYIGAIGDGYVTQENITEIAKNNFSGRQYKIPITKEWIKKELAKYNPDDSKFLWNYVKKNHDSKKIIKQYLRYMPQIHLVVPFYRHENKEILIKAYEPMGIILHPIMFQDEITDWNKSWIYPLVIPMDVADCNVKSIECFKRNWFIKNGEIIDEDYYVCADDDDMYEDRVFDKIKEMDDDIVIISMKRGRNIPKNVIAFRRYPTDTLIAHPDHVKTGEISGQQLFVKGRIYKEHLFDPEDICDKISTFWDGELAIHYKETETIRYEPDLFALFNYYEPERWDIKPTLLSVVVVAHSDKAHNCLEAISNIMKGYRFALIVIDNGSDPAFIPNVPCLVERNSEKKDIHMAINKGVRLTIGDIVILVDGNIVPTPEDISSLIANLNVYDVMGPANRDMGEILAFKKSVFDEIGMFENPLDNDEMSAFCLKAKKRGFKVGIKTMKRGGSMAKPVLKLGDKEIVGDGSFAINEPQEGLISIIIPVLNQLDMTYECLQAVMENTEGYEIVIIDNGSDPLFQPPFSGFNEIRVIRNEGNKGYPIAINQGVKEAKGDTIILLNNDVFVTPGALNRLVNWLDTFDIVGPLTNYAGGLQAVQIPAYNSIDELKKEAEFLFESSEGECQEVNWIIGFCIAFKRSTWDQVGNFDESLWPCSGEEIDFCLKAKDQGFTIGVAQDIYVHHEGSVTFRDMQDAGQLKYMEICKRTDQHLKDRWGYDFWNHQLITEDIAPISGINLNLGCGFTYKEGFVNIDNRPEVEPDLVCDITEGLPYEDSSVDSVRAHDFLEHIPPAKVIFVMDEIWRVLKPGGKFDSFTPSTDGRGAFMDPTHVSFWNICSWLYYSDDAYRNIYGIKAKFKLDRIEDSTTNQGMGIIHTHVIATTIKGEG